MKYMKKKQCKNFAVSAMHLTSDVHDIISDVQDMPAVYIMTIV